MSFLKKVADTFLSTEDDMDDDIQKYRKQRSIEKEYPVFTSPSNVQYRTEGERVIEREREKREGSKYNIFVKEKYAEIKETHPEMDKTKIFAEIGRLWQEEKKKEKFNPKKDEMIEHGKQNQINILKKIKELFPKVDIDFYENILREDNYSGSLFNINMEHMTYSEFIGYKLYREMNEIVQYFSFDTPYGDWMTFLDELNPNIFMNNVNIEWKLLQLAKKDTSILIPPNPPPPLPKPPEKPSAPKRNSPKSPPKPPEKPTAPKRNSPKSPPKPPEQPSAPKRNSPKSPSKSPPKPPPLPSAPKMSSPKKTKLKITADTLQTAKSKLKHSQIELKPDNPDYDLEMAFRKLENKSKSPPKSKSRKNENLSNTELENLFKKK